MNKMQARGDYKSQRKRHTRAVALAQVAASKIPHLKHSEHPQQNLPARNNEPRISFGKETNLGECEGRRCQG